MKIFGWYLQREPRKAAEQFTLEERKKFLVDVVRGWNPNVADQLQAVFAGLDTERYYGSEHLKHSLWHLKEAVKKNELAEDLEKGLAWKDRAYVSDGLVEGLRRARVGDEIDAWGVDGPGHVKAVIVEKEKE